MKYRTNKETGKEEIYLEFSIGRGGRFNDEGFLTLVGVDYSAKSLVESKNFTMYENEIEVCEEISERMDIDFDQVRDDLFCDVDDAKNQEKLEKYGVSLEDFGRLILHCNGNEIGELVEDGQEFCYDVDGGYDTTYGGWFSKDDLTDKQISAIERAYSAEFDEVREFFGFADDK